MKKLNKNMLIYSILYSIILLFLKLILNKLNLEFMSWFYYLSFNLIYITAVIGIFQLILKINKKSLRIISIFITTILVIGITYIFLVIQMLFYQPTHLIKKDSNKMEVSVHYWDKLFSLNYYEYKNPLMRSYENIDNEIFSRDPELYKIDKTTYSYDPFECIEEYKKVERKSYIRILLKHWINLCEYIFEIAM